MGDVVILTNEAGLFDGKAPLGQHSTLAYACAAIAEGHEVFLIDHSRTSLKSCVESKNFPALKLDRKNFKEYVELYWQQNLFLANLTKNAGAELLTSDSDVEWNKVAERQIKRAQNMVGEKVKLSVDHLKNSYLINRLDPMLASFTKQDREATSGNVYQYFLAQYKSLIPNLDFTDPSGKSDKIAAEEVDAARAKAGLAPIYTPTWKATVDNFDTKFAANLQEVLRTESQLFSREAGSEFENLPQRVVFKPIDSAQSSGVCGMEFREDGIDLAQLQKTPIMQLIAEDLQLLYVKTDLDFDEVKEMAKILLYAQALKEIYPETAKLNGAGTKPEVLKELSETSSEKIAAVTKTLYETEILLQPFLIGVAKMGDVRVNLVADSQGNWSSAGHTFRAQISKAENSQQQKIDSAEPAIGSRFTTCFSAGKAAPTRVEYMLSSQEIQSFNDCVAALISILNGPLKDSYAKCQELGVDFVPVGDGKNFKLGEINHADPALAPVSAALRKGAYDLACEIRDKSQRSIKEEKFLAAYNFAHESEFVANEYQGGLGPMITSLRNAIARQNGLRIFQSHHR